MEWLFYAATGAVAGFFAGLLGIGGGVVISPMLIFFLPSRMPGEVATHAAIATALAVTTVTAASSFAAHARGRAVDWRAGGTLACAAAAAALAVGSLAWRIPAAGLQALLAVFLLLMSAHLFAGRTTSGGSVDDGGGGGGDGVAVAVVPQLPRGVLFFAGGGIGAVSALLGIAGGIMTVPFLARRRFPMRRAIGTSAFVGFPLAAAACVGYIGGGWENPALPAGSWGFVYLPAFVGIAVFSAAFAAVGARASARLSEKWLRRIFGALLVVAALRLLATVLG